jgi:hypothetical protein
MERPTAVISVIRASSLLAAAALALGAAEYRPVSETATLRAFTLTVTPAGEERWVSFVAEKKGGGRFAVHFRSRSGVRQATRYLLQEGEGPVREFRHALTGAAVVPSIGGWEQLFPAGEAESINVLGHAYRRTGPSDAAVPEPAETVMLWPDMLIGPAHNTRQKDETRRYDTSDYEYIKLTEDDYRTMAAAGITCVNVDERQAEWAERLGLFYWGTASLPYPEMLYRPQYLGPVLFLDEPAVGTRDHVLRPRMEKDPAARRTISPESALEAFRTHFAGSAERNASALLQRLRARKDIDVGSLHFTQANLYSWETMEATAGYQLSQDPHVPAAFVWEPAGRVGTRRTIPELNMNYGTRFPLRPDVLPSIINGFLRGAARATGKQWGISIYGAVERADAPYLLTRAYDDGATRFFFWDNYQLACVPFGEVLAHARHLRAHAAAHPRLDVARRRERAELAIVIPAGYNLGHVHLGKGLLWGLPELHRERKNRDGVAYGDVMAAAFAEMESAMRNGEAFDVVWDLPQLAPRGYKRVVRIDGKTKGPRHAAAAGAPGLAVALRAEAEGWHTASAQISEGPSPVFYTTGADATGVYQNARVYWELYGPEEMDMRIVPPGEAVRFQLTRAGRYRLRAAIADEAGRSTVVWKEIVFQP